MTQLKVDLDTCSQCGDMITTEELEEVSGHGFICPDCIDYFWEDHSSCDRCGAVESYQHMRVVENDTLCERCAIQYAAQCDDCGEWGYDDHIHYIDGYGSYCDTHLNGCLNLFWENHDECLDCESIVHHDYMVYDDDCDEYVCESCFSARERNRSRLKQYHSGTTLHFKHECKNDQRRWYIGAEIEVDFKQKEEDEFPPCIGEIANNLYRLSANESRFHMEMDGSLQNGIEFVFHPRSSHYWEINENNLDEWAEAVKAAGGKGFYGRNCGIHLHVSRERFTPILLGKLINFFLQCENHICKVAHRRSDYADWGEFRNIWVRDRELWEEIRWNKELFNFPRYLPINTQNEDTVEIRIFRSNLKTDVIRNYIRFMDHLLLFLDTVGIQSVKSTDIWKRFTDFVKPKSKALHDFLVEHSVEV